MKLLELFSGTHSIGKVCEKRGIEVVSLDRDIGAECPFNSGYKSKKHFKEDIMTWDYKQFEPGHFDIITASPVCLWWSRLRFSWIGRKLKHMDRKLTRQDIEDDILKYGIPMVDKMFEIIDYLRPKFYWIENPQTGRMKEYINPLIPFYDVDYCKYSDFGYKKTTRFWTNIEGFKPKLCNKECGNINKNKHKIDLGGRKLYRHIRSADGGSNSTDYLGTTLKERYRIPPKLIEELFYCLLIND